MDSAAVTGPHPVSFAQRQLWFLNQLNRHGGDYNVSAAWSLSGELSIEALDHAVEFVVNRHEALRTTFSFVGHEPVQWVQPPRTVRLTVADVPQSEPEEPLERARTLAGEEASIGFDLARGPLLRATLFRLAPSEYLLLVVVHHIAADGWSMGILWKDISVAYAHFKRGLAPELPTATLQYTEYAAWQRRWLTGEQLESRTAAWRERLTGLVRLNLPLDKRRPARRSGLGEAVPLEASTQLVTAARAFARQKGVTLFMVLLTTFEVLLHRLTQERRIVVGTPVSGRTQREFDDLVGPVINTVGIREDVEPLQTFVGLVDQTRDRALHAYEHADTPFECVVEALAPDRDLSETPVFQALISMQGAPRPPQMSGVRVSRVSLPCRFAKFDLSLVLREEDDGGLGGRLEYAADLFDRESVARWGEYFVRLLGGAVDDPSCPISRLPMVSAEEGRQLCGWHVGPEAKREADAVHVLFEDSVVRDPGAIAVSRGGDAVSYQELNARANQLARWLRAAGLASEEMVGVCIEPSAELLVAVLATLKAGGVCVPLHGNGPSGRLTERIRELGIAIVLCSEASAGWVPDEVRRVLLDEERSSIAQFSRENVAGLCGASDLAYVVQTSGSSGEPRNVGLEHRSLVNLVQSCQERYGIGGSDRVALCGAVGSYRSLWEILVALCCGAQLVIPNHGVDSDASQLTAFLQREGVTCVHLHSSVLRRLEPEGLEAIRLVLTGSSPFGDTLVRAWASPSCVFVNAYGAAEITCLATTADFEGPTSWWHPNIGRPIANVCAYVLDDQGEPAPVGVPGTLWVGGVGVARGYINQPALTAERFAPDPFISDRSATMFNTGDRVRRTSDGSLEFIGRHNMEVIIQGRRVQLEEVEAALEQHPDVRQAMVALDTQSDPTRLVAYVESDNTHAAKDIATHARRSLRGHETPDGFVIKSELRVRPPTAVGEMAVDERVRAEPGRQPTFRAPTTLVERVLACVWLEILPVARVGLDDDFFQLGGDSLAATQAVYGATQALGGEIPVKLLFENPTLGAFAMSIEEDVRTNTRASRRPDTARIVEDARLAEDVRPQAHQLQREVADGLLVTGATGFLGAFVLRALCALHRGPVICLVRGRDTQPAVIRLSSALEAYGLAGIEKEPGVEVVVGDFTAKRLGLSAEEYRDLAKRVGVIYHCGAEVDLLAQYADLASANVGGTEELLRFAVAGCPKAFHHVSTAGALSRKSGRAFRVADLLAEGDHLPRSGYGQSKWVAEQLVRQARRRGVRASIYRPGRIVADSATGAWNTRDLVARLLIGSLRLGVAPALALTEWVVPVDLAASALVQLSMEYRGTLESVMLASREEVRFNDLVLAVQACGFSIELVDVQKWLRAVRGTIGAVADPLLHPLLSIVEALATGTRAVGPTGQSDAWEDGLTLAGLSSPRLSELVGGWLSAWSRDGLIPDRSS